MVARLRTHCSSCGREWPEPRTSTYCDQLCRDRRRTPDREAERVAEQLRLEIERETLPAYSHRERSGQSAG